MTTARVAGSLRKTNFRRIEHSGRLHLPAQLGRYFNSDGATRLIAGG
jgi:hypothetical protein